ncbi:MAG TPA: PAS-domain containing protein, partial [Aestuariivirgaceae bacterium]|nr:PAS-domain containing protein [Aestuariivirgaceae bacterium]
MVPGAVVILFALSYVGFLFATASYGDRLARRRAGGGPRPLIYALSLGVYCTSWTFFGSVGLSARSGFDFLPIYIGPIIVFALGWPLVARIVAVSKRHNITSVADFISARYGKNQALGALVAIVAVIGAIPYISLQLKAVALALQTMLPLDLAVRTGDVSPAADYLALLVTIAMAAFASLFGTRHIDATEHQDGMILAIAVESIVKIASFLLVGAFVTFSMMGGLGPLLERVTAEPDVAAVFSRDLNWSRWLTMTGLAMVAILLLPRQFHVAVVENSHIGDVKRAAWLFPLYLVAINVFVVPIAAAGLLTFGPAGTDPDSFVLALPVAVNSQPVAMLAFLGGLSAATAMVIVEAVALSIMVCNNLVLPILLRARSTETGAADMGGLLILIRRAAISCILLLAFIHYEAIGNSAALAQIGLISFAAIAQLAPAFLAGLYWRRGTGTGASAAIMGGFAVWSYTLLIPSFADAGWVDARLITEGPFGLAFLRPRNLLNLELDPLVHGVAWSLVVNLVTLVAVSLLRQPLPIETIQANLFTRREARVAPLAHRHGRSSVKLGELRATIAQYLGAERAERAFTDLARSSGQAFNANAEADVRSLRHAEHLLASAVGAASSRLIMWLLLERRAPNKRRALELLDEATHAIQYNRDLLQSAIDHVQQGIAVFDDRLGLTCWNRQFLELLGLPPRLDRVGITLVDVFESFQSSGGTSHSP